MKRSGFSQKTRLRAVRAFSSVRSAFKSTKQPVYKLGRKRWGIKRQGKKAKLRESINRPNRARFAAMGLLNVCEAKLSGCWPNGRLTWAHGKKDRELTMDERKYLVIRCCTICHHRLDEEMSHAEMLEFVESVIANRKELQREVAYIQ